MGRRKRNRLTLKPFCYYCDRQFPDERVLIQHQKAKHFKCLQCSRKLDTATGLVVHMIQVHKVTISKVPHSMAGRDSTDVTIHGMEGVPADVLKEKETQQAARKGVRVLKSSHIVMRAAPRPAMVPVMTQMAQTILPPTLPPTGLQPYVPSVHQPRMTDQFLRPAVAISAAGPQVAATPLTGQLMFTVENVGPQPFQFSPEERHWSEFLRRRATASAG